MNALDGIRMAITDIEIKGAFCSAGTLPPFRGATLRGALGYHLRKTVCNNLKRQCPDCFLVEECAYSNFFDGVFPKDRDFMKLYNNVPQPYMLILPLKEQTDINEGDPISFSMKIFGKAAELFPYVAYSFLQMGEKGLGKDRILFQIDRIEQVGGEILYEKGANRIGKPKSRSVTYKSISVNPTDYLAVRFLTPVRIRKDAYMAKSLQFKDLVTASLRRISIMNYFYGTGEVVDNAQIREMINIAGTVKKVRDKTKYFSFNRYSGRQQRKVRQEGLVGSLVFEGVSPELTGVLKLAEYIGLGKSTSFGFGRINIQVEREGELNG